MIAGKERPLDGVAGVVVVPGGDGQGQDAPRDPDQDVGRGVAAVAFQVAEPWRFRVLITRPGRAAAGTA